MIKLLAEETMAPPKRRVQKVCLNCEAEFEIRYSEAKKGQKYCCRKCYMVHTQRFGGRNKKTGTMKHKGYILEWAPNHPNNQKGYYPQHRLVVERHLGRLLASDEHVHHINEKKDDNRLDNLEVVNPSQHHSEKHFAVEINWDGEIISFKQAIDRCNMERSTVKRRRKKMGWSHQQVIDFYRVNPKWSKA